MIGTTKTEGTAGGFDPSKISGFLSAGRINSGVNLEKAIFSLEYLAQLQKGGLDFVFKGGSAIQVTLQSRWGRLSVDADICTDASEKELLEIMNGINKMFDRAAFSYKARNGPGCGSVPFNNYIIDVPSIVENGGARNRRRLA